LASRSLSGIVHAKAPLLDRADLAALAGFLNVLHRGPKLRSDLVGVSMVRQLKGIGMCGTVAASQLEGILIDHLAQVFLRLRCVPR
jgi:hypothetical protein